MEEYRVEGEEPRIGFNIVGRDEDDSREASRLQNTNIEAAKEEIKRNVWNVPEEVLELYRRAGIKLEDIRGRYVFWRKLGLIDSRSNGDRRQAIKNAEWLYITELDMKREI